MKLFKEAALLLPLSLLSLVGLRRRTGMGVTALGVLLGVVALIPLGLELLFVLRGVFYGLVDHGPYDHSWGGPTRAGAWAVHFAISVPLAAAATAALIGLGALYERLTTRPTAGPIALALVIPIPAVVFFIAWLHQI